MTFSNDHASFRPATNAHIQTLKFSSFKRTPRQSCFGGWELTCTESCRSDCVRRVWIQVEVVNVLIFAAASATVGVW